MLWDLLASAVPEWVTTESVLTKVGHPYSNICLYQVRAVATNRLQANWRTRETDRDWNLVMCWVHSSMHSHDLQATPAAQFQAHK